MLSLKDLNISTPILIVEYAHWLVFVPTILFSICQAKLSQVQNELRTCRNELESLTQKAGTTLECHLQTL